MSLDKAVIDKAVGGKYTEFSAEIKTELHKKMSSHPDTVKYADDYDKIQSLKQIFAQVSGSSEE